MNKCATVILIVVLILILILTVCLARKMPLREVLVSGRSTKAFLILQDNPDVFYEPGAEANAHIIATSLPAAPRRVEDAQYGRFTVPGQNRMHVSPSSWLLNTGIHLFRLKDLAIAAARLGSQFRSTA